MEIKKGPPHISYCFIFESDCLSNFQSTTHTYGQYFENKPICDMIIIKLFTWFINLLVHKIYENPS